MVILRPGILVLLIVFAATCAVPASPTRAAEPMDPFAVDQVIVALQPGYRLTPAGRVFDSRKREVRAGLHPRLTSAEQLDPDGDVALLRLREGTDILATVAALRAHPAVRLAEPNYLRTYFRTPNDPDFSDQWALPKIQAPAAWDITTGSEKVIVAVLDSGVSPTHEDLQANLLHGYNAVREGSDTRDDIGHGTFTAGLIAASTDNGKGIAGICWKCRILPVKVGVGPLVYSHAVIKGIKYAVARKARVISMSFGGPQHSDIEQDVINYAHQQGVLLAASSGNEGADGNPVNYPAAYDNVVAVAATGNTDQVSGFSSYGPFVDMAAPGIGIWSTVWENGSDGYAVLNGTSFSCPYVAGAAGLVFSIWPELQPDQVAQLLMATADDVGDPGRDDYYGYGRLNAYRAVAQARDHSIPALPQQPPQKERAFAPVGPPADPAVAYFPETGHTLRGAFKAYWEQNGGLPVFGLPISEELVERTTEGYFVVQYFERERFEYHPENQPPYHVLLGRLGDDVLRQQQRDWFTFPKADPAAPHYFPETGHAIAAQFWHYWSSHGLEFGDPGVSTREALALFGLPLSEPMMETNASGDHVLTQHFERARFEYHSNNPPGYQVLLGLLGNESVDLRGWR